MRKLNYLQIAIAMYVVAIVIYGFMNNHSTGWSLYRDYYITALVLILIWFAFKKERTELDKALIIGIGMQRCFSLLCFQYWYSSGADWWDTPLWYSIIVAVCLFIGIIIKRKKIWK